MGNTESLSPSELLMAFPAEWLGGSLPNDCVFNPLTLAQPKDVVQVSVLAIYKSKESHNPGMATALSNTHSRP